MADSDPSGDSSCPCCHIVNRLCFWGPLPEKRWKRPLLFLTVLPFIVGIPVLFWLFQGHSNIWELYVSGGALLLIAALGLLVAVKGCDACVARLVGGV